MNAPLRILIVEDNEGDAFLLLHQLPTERQTDVRCVCLLSEALAAVDAEQFDIVLLDLGLPDSFGLATLTAMRQHAVKLPIIVLTGNNDEQTGLEAIRDGAQDYLVKGEVDKNLLARSIKYALERRRVENALKELNDTLEERIVERTAQINAVNEKLRTEIAERTRAEQTAEAASLAKSQFLVNMSHELRTPMAGIMGMLQLAIEAEIPQKPREYLEATLNSARSLMRILNDILDMATAIPADPVTAQIH